VNQRLAGGVGLPGRVRTAPGGRRGPDRLSPHSSSGLPGVMAAPRPEAGSPPSLAGWGGRPEEALPEGRVRPFLCLSKPARALQVRSRYAYVYLSSLPSFLYGVRRASGFAPLNRDLRHIRGRTDLLPYRAQGGPPRHAWQKPWSRSCLALGVSSRLRVVGSNRRAGLQHLVALRLLPFVHQFENCLVRFAGVPRWDPAHPGTPRLSFFARSRPFRVELWGPTGSLVGCATRVFP
jgi:hypothetical protein